MPKRILDSPTMYKQTGRPVGPYSQAVAVTGGTLVFIAGQVAWGPDGRVVGKGDLAAQYRHIMKNLKAILAEVGGTMNDLVKITNFVTRRVTKSEAYPQIAEVRKEYITKDFPVSSMIEVEALMDPDLLVEVETVAVVDSLPG
ncbi:MAG: RidA family protein [Nitrospinota bacterium]|nr:RidA family protein [Nitrospinota bacterium]MDP6618345.1 RidA family protein [Nitrospinota bacterium]